MQESKNAELCEKLQFPGPTSAYQDSFHTLQYTRISQYAVVLHLILPMIQSGCRYYFTLVHKFESDMQGAMIFLKTSGLHSYSSSVYREKINELDYALQSSTAQTVQSDAEALEV